MKKTKLTPISAKNKLIKYYDFKEVDFYQDGEEIRLNCKDNVGERAVDVFQELELQRKEEYVIAYDPYEPEGAESKSIGVMYKIKNGIAYDFKRI